MLQLKGSTALFDWTYLTLIGSPSKKYLRPSQAPHAQQSPGLIADQVSFLGRKIIVTPIPLCS